MTQDYLRGALMVVAMYGTLTLTMLLVARI